MYVKIKRVRRRRRRRRRQKPQPKQLLGKGINRPYVDKRNRLMLGSGSGKKTLKQRGSFFPLVAVLLLHLL